MYLFIIFFHRCQRLFLTRSLRFAGQPLAGQPGVEQTTVPLKEQEDGAWKDVVLLPVQNIVYKYYDYIDEKSFPICNHKLVGLHWGVASTWVCTVLVQFSD